MNRGGEAERDSASRSHEPSGHEARWGRDVSFWVLETALDNWRLVLGLPLLAVVAVLLITWVSSSTYTSRTSFTPQAEKEQQANVSGLARQFGVDVPRQGGGASTPAFYAYLLETDQLLRATVESHFEAAGALEDSTATLAGFWAGTDSLSEQEVEIAVDKLRERTRVRIEPEIGLVHLAVTMKNSSLAQTVAARMVDLVNQFNLETRRSQAAEEVEFLKQRVRVAREDLRVAEDSLRAFYEQNRQYQNSPTLQFEADRLERRVSLQQGVYTSLAQSLEDARIQEVRNTPVITVVQPSHVPASPDTGALLIKLFVAGMLGFVVAWSWLAGKTWFLGGLDEDVRDRKRLRRKWEQVKDEWASLSGRGG